MQHHSRFSDSLACIPARCSRSAKQSSYRCCHIIEVNVTHIHVAGEWVPDHKATKNAIWQVNANAWGILYVSIATIGKLSSARPSCTKSTATFDDFSGSDVMNKLQPAESFTNTSCQQAAKLLCQDAMYAKGKAAAGSTQVQLQSTQLAAYFLPFMCSTMGASTDKLCASFGVATGPKIIPGFKVTSCQLQAAHNRSIMWTRNHIRCIAGRIAIYR